jgi:hypothetical protein
MASELVPDNTLIAATPDEGRALGIKLAMLTVKTIQPDDEVRQRLRPSCAESAGSLAAAAQVVAIEFATIAAANDHRRSVTEPR